MINFVKKHKLGMVIGLIFLFFVLAHILGLHLPYHQDEYKWIYYSHPEIIPPGTVPHTPLTEFIYTRVGHIVGDLNFRFIPFIFGVFNFFLVFYLAKTIFDKKTAVWATLLFAVSYYSLLASLMVDVDGAVMPFFFLLSLIGYYKFKEKNFTFNRAWLWFLLLSIGALGGFLIKVVFAIPIAVLAFDFALDKKVFSDKKKIFKAGLWSLSGIVVLIVVLLSAKYVFPFFNLGYAMKYWEHFANFGVRNWFQTFIEFAKAILYTSPLLLAPLFFADKEIFKKTKPLIIFLATEIVFYLFVFDFSTGALDRYFQFMVIPLCIISGAIISKAVFSGKKDRDKEFVLLGVIISLIFLLLVFMPHFVPSLHPKSAWVSRFFSLKWNFLYPFSGGSGPLGFYVSFLFISLSWIFSVCLFVLAIFKPRLRKMAILIFLPIGLVYNFVFTEEYLFGKINGSAPKLLAGAVEFIKNDNQIKSVTVYNDNGGYDLQSIGKYKRRMYVDPSFSGYKEYLNANKDYYFVLDVPRIDPTSFFTEYFNSCLPIYRETDKKISATVFDCKNAISVKTN